jgi:hypothetical protein
LHLFSSRSIFACALLLLLSLVSASAQDASSPEAVKLLPKTVGEFRLQSQSARPLDSLPKEATDPFGVRDAAEGVYVSPKGERLTVSIFTARSHAGAYSLLTRASAQMKSAGAQTQATKLSDVGVAGVAVPAEVAFYKGPVFVGVTGKSKAAAGVENSLLLTFSRAYAATLPEAENEIPVLVKHLPEWETAAERAIYAISLQGLEAATGQQPIFEAINFNEGAEAVTATYDASRLVIIEYTTPQIAADTDARITARLQELRAQGQSVPSSYRRVGNYSVFVFNSPDETAAAQLIDRVKWEQSIQWLGENPLLWARAEKQHTREAVGLILGIARTIGFFVMICLGVGGIFGGIFFLRRKAQQRALEAAESYSDAGGMLRLNIDELTPEPDPARLLAAGDEKPVAH